MVTADFLFQFVLVLALAAVANAAFDHGYAYSTPALSLHAPIHHELHTPAIAYSAAPAVSSSNLYKSSYRYAAAAPVLAAPAIHTEYHAPAIHTEYHAPALQVHAPEVRYAAAAPVVAHTEYHAPALAYSAAPAVSSQYLKKTSVRFVVLC